MFKYMIVLCLMVAATMANPKPDAGVAFAAPAVAPAVVTAQSSQVIARNYNAFAAPLVAPAAPVVPAVAPVAAAYYRSAPYVAAPAVAPAVAAPYVAAPYSPYFTSPVVV